MRPWICALSLAFAACSSNGPCCSDGDCWANYVCSAHCASDGQVKGTCEQRCQVDSDCATFGEVCDEFDVACACQAAADAGVAGSCPQG